jgi:hypothetical protein
MDLGTGRFRKSLPCTCADVCAKFFCAFARPLLNCRSSSPYAILSTEGLPCSSTNTSESPFVSIRTFIFNCLMFPLMTKTQPHTYVWFLLNSSQTPQRIRRWSQFCCTVTYRTKKISGRESRESKNLMCRPHDPFNALSTRRVPSVGFIRPTDSGHFTSKNIRPWYLRSMSAEILLNCCYLEKPSRLQGYSLKGTITIFCHPDRQDGRSYKWSLVILPYSWLVTNGNCRPLLEPRYSDTLGPLLL